MGEQIGMPAETGYDPNEVWREIRFIEDQNTRIGPILRAHYATLVQGQPDSPTVSTLEKIERLREAIRRGYARLALAAVPSLTTSPQKRAQALGLGTRLNALLTHHDLTREDLRDAQALPATPSKSQEAAELAKTHAAEDAEITALTRQIAGLKRLFTGKHGFDRVLIYLWLDRLLITGTVPTPDQFILLLQQHAQRSTCVSLVEEMQEAAGEPA